MRRTTWPLALLLSFFVACGNDHAADPQPTPTPLPTPVPTVTARPTPGCGNGLIDDGEFCDGQDFCPPDCSLLFGSCCELSDLPSGTACGNQGAPSPHACADAHGVFSVGTTCEGSSCDEAAGICTVDGHCAGKPIDPVSVCCQLDGACEDRVFTDTEALAQYALFDCGLDPRDGKTVLGVCGEAGVCVRAPAD